MTIYLVGENIDRRTAHARAQSGELLRLMHGVYVDRNDDADVAVIAFAVRIALYLYPQSYLSSASAVLLAPSSDGRLFISGRRNQRTRLRSLEIVQNEAPKHPSTMPAIVRDALGNLHVNASSPRQRFLEAFRLRSEHANAIDDRMREEIAERLLTEYGTKPAVADALWELARSNSWLREAERAELYLVERRAVTRAHRVDIDLVVAWHGVPIGRLTHDGSEWHWAATSARGAMLARDTVLGRLPPFIESLLPEGWLARVLRKTDERELLIEGRRYMSNITIVADRALLRTIPDDVLTTALANYTLDGRFSGDYAGPTRSELDDSFATNLAAMYAEINTPRLSGIQMKAPMCLTSDGTLIPAIEDPFTHILKPAGLGGFESIATVEWFCAELGRVAGFDVPSTALIDMPDGMAPALVVERFDIRRTAIDQRFIALEDFCSILGQPANAKYDGSIERVARSLRSVSSDPVADLERLFRRALFAWLVADGDMHLKNLAVIKIARPRGKRFASVRLAPLFDVVATRVLPGLQRDRMALSLNGKDDRLTLTDFRSLAKTIGVSMTAAEDIVATTVADTRAAVSSVSLPAVELSDDLRQTIDRVREIVEQRARAFS